MFVFQVYFKRASIGSRGLLRNNRTTITITNDDTVHWHLYVTIDLNELLKPEHLDYQHVQVHVLEQLKTF